MPKPFPLQIVLDLMQSRTDAAARELGRRIACERDAKAQLRMLEDYRAEYAERFRSAVQGGMTHQQWQNYRDFLARLDEAVGAQTVVVAGNEHKTVQGKLQWLDQKNRLRAFDTLADRHLDRERRLEGRREQKFTDEIAARRHGGDTKDD